MASGVARSARRAVPKESQGSAAEREEEREKATLSGQREQTLTEGVRNLLQASVAAKTAQRYRAVAAKFLQFTKSEAIESGGVTQLTLANFLAKEREKGARSRSALEHRAAAINWWFFTENGVKLPGDVEIVHRLIQGAGRLAPRMQMKKSEGWDLEKVMAFIRKSRADNGSLSDHELLGKMS